MATMAAHLHQKSQESQASHPHSHSHGHRNSGIRRSSYSGSASSSTLIVTPLSFKVRERSASPISPNLLAPPLPNNAPSNNHTTDSALFTSTPAVKATATAEIPPTQTRNPALDISSKGHLEPHVSNLPRRRRTLKSSHGNEHEQGSALGLGLGLGLGLELKLKNSTLISQSQDGQHECERDGNDDVKPERDVFLLPSPIALPQLPDLLMGVRVGGSNGNDDGVNKGDRDRDGDVGKEDRRREEKTEEQDQHRRVQTPPSTPGLSLNGAQVVAAPASSGTHTNDGRSDSPAKSGRLLSSNANGDRRSTSPRAPARKGFSFTVPNSAPAVPTSSNWVSASVSPLAPTSFLQNVPATAPIRPFSQVPQWQSQQPLWHSGDAVHIGRQIPRYPSFYHTQAQIDQAHANGRAFPPFLASQSSGSSFKLVPDGIISTAAGELTGAKRADDSRGFVGGENVNNNAPKAHAGISVLPYPIVAAPAPLPSSPAIRRNFASHALASHLNHPQPQFHQFHPHSGGFGAVPSPLKNLPRRQRGRRQLQLHQLPLTEQEAKKEKRRLWERRWMVQEVGRRSGVFVGCVEVGDGSYLGVGRSGKIKVQESAGAEPSAATAANANGDADGDKPGVHQVPKCNWGMGEWDEDQLEEGLPDFGGWKRVVVVNVWLGGSQSQLVDGDIKGKGRDNVESPQTLDGNERHDQDRSEEDCDNDNLSSSESVRINRSPVNGSGSAMDIIKSIDLIVDKTSPLSLERNDHGITSLTKDQIHRVSAAVQEAKRMKDEEKSGSGDVAVLVLARSRLCLVDAMSLAGYLIVDLYKHASSTSQTGRRKGYTLPSPPMQISSQQPSNVPTSDILSFPDDAQDSYHEIHSLFMHLHDFGFATVTKSQTPPYPSSPLSVYARVHSSLMVGTSGGAGGSGGGAVNGSSRAAGGGSMSGNVPLISNNGNGLKLRMADECGNDDAVARPQYATYAHPDEIEGDGEWELDTDVEDDDAAGVKTASGQIPPVDPVHAHERGLKGIWRGLVSRDGMDFLVEVMEKN